MANVAINGLGRIGRATLKILLDTPGLRPVAVNDLVPPDNLAYLLRYDTVYGRYGKRVEAGEGRLRVEGADIRVFGEKDPARLPWKDLGVDLVFECTGKFTRREDLEKHVQAGARHAILSAPGKGTDLPTVVYGVNSPDPNDRVLSCASCTTNALTPAVEIVGRRIGLRKAVMTTIHAYTSSQSLVDGPNKKWRRGRAAAANLVPASTGGAVATTRVLPQYAGKFDGVAVRAPVIVGSVADIVFATSRPTSVEEVNAVFREEAASDRYRDVVAAVDEEIVSSDIIGDAHASIVDLTVTAVVDGDLLKVFAWYDNEWGYSNQMVRTARRLVGG